MTACRRLLAVASAGLAVAALTGCERPAPIVTVVSGTTSEWKEADVFCFEEGATFGDDECVQRASGPTRIPVEPGRQVGIDVSREVVERGWYLELGSTSGQGEAQQSPVQEDKHYFAFTAPQIGPEGLRLTIRSLGGESGQGEPTGEWVFDLVPAA